VTAASAETLMPAAEALARSWRRFRRPVMNWSINDCALFEVMVHPFIA
jgi:hypothetical protein